MTCIGSKNKYSITRKFGDDDYEFFGGKGQLMIAKGARVIARGKLEKKNMYHLVIETMVGENYYSRYYDKVINDLV